MASSADDNTPYSLSPYSLSLSSSLSLSLLSLCRARCYLEKAENYTINICEWFQKNSFKFKIDKCNLITIDKSEEEIQLGETSLTSINRVKLLGIHIDGRLNFDYHINQL